MEASGFPWGKKKVDPAGHLTGSPGSELSEKTVRFNAPRSPGQWLLHQDDPPADISLGLLSLDPTLNFHSD